MNLNALMNFMMLHLMHQSENDSNINAPAKINDSPEIELVNLPPRMENINNDLDNRYSNEEFSQDYDLTTRLFPTYDCSMPKPPTLVTDIPPIIQHKIKDYGIDGSTQSSNMEKNTKEIAIKENTNPQEAQPSNENGQVLHSKASIRIDLNHQSPNLISNRLEPKSKQELIGNVENPKTVEVEIMNAKPRAKASMEIPLHIVHKLPDAQVLDLMRFESYCEDKIHDVYTAIRVFNNFNYQKNQELQYLSYSDKRKEEILKESNENKDNIKLAYVKMHRVCGRAESKRDEITTILTPFAKQSVEFYAQPARIPKCWYDLHNLEVIILQLFTPKMTTRTYFDENEQVLRMRPRAKLDLTHKRFIALPNDYVSPASKPNEEPTIDGSSLIVENNQPKTAIENLNEIKLDDQLNNNAFEEYTYSTREDIQQIIIYYQFKYWEHEVQDLTRKVFYFSKMLKQKKRLHTDEKEISKLEKNLADAIAELQAATLEMERNRVVPEIVNLYNAENEAHDLLPNTKFISKLIGDKHRRVLIDVIPGNALTEKQSSKDMDAKEKNHELDREDLAEALEWDRNWSWDF